MTDDANNPFSSLGTLTAQLLGVVAILTREVVRAKAVDVARLQQSLDAFWEQEGNAAELSDGDRRMLASVQRVIGAAIAQTRRPINSTLQS